jgi:mRNA interferase YafQ
MKTFRPTRAFRKDLKRLTRRGYDLVPLTEALEFLRRAAKLPAARLDHSLKGEWKGWRECHIQPDWLLIYKVTDAEVLLARTGTHSDLFGS